MYNHIANESSQRRQHDYDPPRYVVDGGRIFSVSAQQNSQNNSDGGRTLSSNAAVQNSATGGMYIVQATQSVGIHDIPSFSRFTKSTQSSSIPAQTNQGHSTGQHSLAFTSTTGTNYGHIASIPASVSAVQQQRQLVTPPERRPGSYSSAPEQQHQSVRQPQLAPPSNWPLSAPPQGSTYAASGMMQPSAMSGGQSLGYAAPPPQMQPAPAPPSVFPNPVVLTQPTALREGSATVFANSSVALPSSSTRDGPPAAFSNQTIPAQSTSTREANTPLPPATVSEAEAGLFPVRGALEGLWRTISSAHTTALAKEREARIATVRALNDERRANGQLQAHLQAQMKREQELRIAAKGSANELSLTEETIRRFRAEIEKAREEGRKQGRKDGRQELNALQLDFEGVQTELSEQKILVARLKTEAEQLRRALRSSDRLVAHTDQEMLRLLLEIPPTREQIVPPQSTEYDARLHDLLQGVCAVHDKLNEHRAMKQKVTDLVQIVNMDLLALVDNWTRRGDDVLLSSRWKKAWTTAAINGQGSVRSARNRTSSSASCNPAAASIAARKNSTTSHLSLLDHGAMSASASPSILSSISRTASLASSATSISTPPPSPSATAPPVSGSSHATPIDVDLEGAFDQLPSTMHATTSNPPSPTTKYRGLLDVIAEARQNFGLPKSSSNLATSRADADISTGTPARQDYRSAYGLMALPPTPRDFNDPDPNDPDYDSHEVPRLSPPAEDSVSASRESSLSQREQRGWRLRTPPPTSTPASPINPVKELSSHIPSSPCLLKEAMPLKRVASIATGSASPMIIDAAAPLCLGAVSAPPVVGTTDTGASSVTSGKRTRSEFEEGQDIHGYGELDSRGGSIETERKRRAPCRPSLPPILVKPEPMDNVFDQSATLILDGTPAPEEEQEMDELEGDGADADTTVFALKQELVDEAMPADDPGEPSPESVSDEGGPPVSRGATLPPPSVGMDDLEEGEITPDTPVQRTSPLRLPSPPPPSVCAVAADVPPTASSAMKQRAIPDMVRRTRPSDHPQSPVVSSSTTHPQCPPQISKTRYTKLGISHIGLLYRTQGKNLVCRMCETRPRDGEKKALTVTRYPENAPWDTLIGHCRRDHPVACEELERKKPSDVAEIKQRLLGSRFGRS